jgi:hypothetical protein
MLIKKPINCWHFLGDTDETVYWTQTIVKGFISTFLTIQNMTQLNTV